MILNKSAWTVPFGALTDRIRFTGRFRRMPLFLMKQRLCRIQDIKIKHQETMTTFSRRDFLYALSMLAAGTAVSMPKTGLGMQRKLRVVLVGTGVRGTSFWGKRLVEQYPDLLEFVGLSDINPGRLAFAKTYMGVQCPTFVDF